MFAILAIQSLTRSLQSIGKRCLQTWTDRQTDRSRILQLIDWISLGADSLKIYISCLKPYRLQHQRSRLVVYYLQHCVGRDEPVVSLGTNSEFIEYIAAVQGRITNCRKDNGINTFTLYSFSIYQRKQIPSAGWKNWVTPLRSLITPQCLRQNPTFISEKPEGSTKAVILSRL